MERNAERTMNGKRSKDEIQEHIQATQEELRHTIEAIGESFSAGEMVDTALHALRVGPGEFAANLGRSVRDNPVAVSLLGAGLAWLMLGTDTRQHLRERAGRMRERAATTSVTETPREKAEGARDVARRGTDRLRAIASEQPLIVAAIGLCAGAAAASVIPRTRLEDRAFGNRAEEAIEQVTEAAGDAARGVSEGARGGFEATGKNVTRGGDVSAPSEARASPKDDEP